MKIIILSLLILFVPLKRNKFINYNQAEKGNYDWVFDKITKMTLREKIGQMIITHSEGYRLDENSKDYLRLKREITEQNIGGIIFFRGNSTEQAELINKLQSISEIPLLISQDSERGTGMRLNDGSIFPNNMAIGAANDTELAYKMGFIIAKECRAIGVHQNYAPVMDINNNPDNPIINVRSFGEDPKLVSDLGTAMIKGMQEGGVIATAKHFPGHGDTDIDSHSDLPVISYGMDRLNKIELVPFRNSVNAGVKSIMIAHLSLPKIDRMEGIPATLSKNIVNGLLINDMKFKGLIVTDALNMEGITKNYSTEEIARLSVKAGIDLILMPGDVSRTIDAIENAVLSGSISEERIDFSVQKILDAKKWLGLDNYKPVETRDLSSKVNSTEAETLSQLIADKSITLVKNSGDLLPIKRNVFESCLVISMNNGNEKANSNLFLEIFGERSKDYFSYYNYFDFSGENFDFENVLEKSLLSDVVIMPVYAKVKIRTGTVGLPQAQVELINILKEKGKKVILISYGNPYLIKAFESIDSYVCAYGDSKSSILAGVKAILGEINFNGKLPVTINNSFKIGTGIIK